MTSKKGGISWQAWGPTNIISIVFIIVSLILVNGQFNIMNVIISLAISSYVLYTEQDIIIEVDPQLLWYPKEYHEGLEYLATLIS